MENIELKNGSSIAVVGGGPSGRFFTYFALDFASHFDMNINIDVYEPKDFQCAGPRGCNHCGGIVSESLIQNLSAEGIVLPANVIRRGIESYTLHLETGTTVIADAVYARPDERSALESAAAKAGVPFHGFGLEAPLEVRMARVGGRTADASDATVDFLRRNPRRETGVMRWSKVDASDSPEATCRAVLHEPGRTGLLRESRGGPARGSTQTDRESRGRRISRTLPA